MDSDVPEPHWAAELIGKPWKAFEAGPDAYDCYGVLRRVYQDRLGITLPPYGYDPKDGRNTSRVIYDAISILDSCGGYWLPVEKPKEYDALGMGQSLFTHVGIYTESDGGFIIHAVDGANVVAERLSRLKQQFKKLKFYRYFHANNR